MSTIGLYNVSHTGRLSAFVEQIAQHNMVGLFFANCSTKLQCMVPFGGKEAKLATNPLAFAAPRQQHYKGFGLALMLEIIAGILSRARMTAADHVQEKNAGFLLALNIKDYLPLENYFSAMEALCKHIKSSPIESNANILLPGERAASIAEKQRQEGINIDKKIWDDVVQVAKTLKI